MLELKRKAIIISSVVALLLFSTVACVRQRTGKAGKNAGKTKVTASVNQSADSLVTAQNNSRTDTSGTGKALLSSSRMPGDSVRADSLSADSTRADSLSNPDDLQSVVQYVSQDSTITDAVLKQVHLYGNAEVTYGTINLKANYIRLNWITNEVYAVGTYDSTAKKIVGDPIFQDGTEMYNTKEIRYNFKSKKALIQGIVTQEGDGNIRGEKVKKDDEGNFYIRHSIYTTCNLTHPHYYINAPKIKMVNKKQVISGPFNLVISDVPLPIALPFGFFPFPKKKETGTSGIIVPTYGEEPNGRGFYLREGGYYFAISEFVNLTLLGQIYSTGSWGLGLSSVYTKRYQYSGNIALRFNRNKSSDEIDRLLGRGITNDFSIVWSHTPRPRGNSTFSANVNVTSNSYNQFQEFDTQRYISNVASSSVQYNRTFGQYMRAAASLRVNQNFGQYSQVTNRREGGKTNISSDFSFGVNQIAPFALRGGQGRWYESFRLGLDFNGNYTLTNSLASIDTSYSTLGFVLTNKVNSSRINTAKTVAFNLNNLPAMLRDAQFTGRYSLPISLPNFKVLRFVNVTPSIGLSGEVFTKQYRYTKVGQDSIRIDTLKQAGTEYTYNFATSLNTRFYGTFFIGGRRLEAIRHTVIPLISFTYTPDFTGDAFGFYERINVTDRSGNNRELSLSKFRGVGSGIGNGRASSVISFSLNNSFEMKLKSKSDTAAAQFEKVSLLDNLSIGGSYNLLADSLNLTNITVNANARIGRNLNLNFNMNLDPYAYEPNPRAIGNQIGTKVNKYAITQGQGLANLQNLGFTLGTSFSPKSSSNNKPKPTTPGQPDNSPTEAQKEFIAQNPDLYVDFNIPWNVSLNYNFGLSKAGLSNAMLIQAIQATGDLSLTKNFKVSVSTGFDFTAFSPTITTLSLYRDLHCWDMSFTWTPFAGSSARVSNYSFTLKVKSAILQDLKVTRRRSFYDRSAY
ncbi:putative LPS assembly protein LptD [Dyadobacter sandarakinus]|uniref:LPS-assembly protein LptD n=1 Tax=Dyadobacter sandarakinus TaxID=2747268 RepID=A0ABX7IAC5_9BACT|nr:putative LPS assembly protein LptD [Dyadobacter sandarakinus]QRR03061.1 LPS-assembly protein LptD [Dyadobacter sandarakinus]